jgi:ferrochelatase
MRAPMSNEKPADHPEIKPARVGVLLLNLGTPDSTDVPAVRRYLREFLSDQRVIEVNPALWWLILNGVILNFRPRKSAHAYAKIWDKAENDSPLRVITRRQTEKLAQRFAGEPKVIVDFAMRYGKPSTESRLRALQEQGCQKILLVPLYPQYSATTTATANDKAFDVLKTMRWQPAVRTVPAYFDDPFYIETLAKSIDEGVKVLDFTPDLVITSYHGMPVTYLQRGDPYHCDCLKTTRLVREYLGWPKDKIMVTFQSRFGNAEWLKPYTAETFAELPKKGIKKIAVATPAFSVDCIETLEEIAITGREQFLEAGGEQFAHIPCLNDSDGGMAMLENMVRRELSGWI